MAQSKFELSIYQQDLYKIDNRLTKLISNNVDEESGLIDEKVMEEINELDLKKEDLIKVFALSYHELNAIANSIEADPIVLEAKRKLALKKRYENTIEGLKKLLKKIVPEGEKIKTEHYEISWRKSSYVEQDDLIDLAELEIHYPDFVKTVRNLRMNEIKAFAKEKGVLPEGLTIKNRQNIQVK